LVSMSIAEVKAVVSIAKLEVHVSFGMSLTIKNLFGLPPPSIYGQPKFLHTLSSKAPRCLVDLAPIQTMPMPS